MARLEDLTTGTRVTGLTASGAATVESANWIGEQGVKVINRDSDGQLGERFMYRDDEPLVMSIEVSRPRYKPDRNLFPLSFGRPKCGPIPGSPSNIGWSGTLMLTRASQVGEQARLEFKGDVTRRQKVEWERGW